MSAASFHSTDIDTFPEDALPMPLEVPEPLALLAWLPISIQGWMFYPGAAEDIDGQPFVAGWLFEKGVARAWVLATHPSPNTAVSLQALVEWVGDGTATYARLQDSSLKWLAGWKPDPTTEIFSGFIPETLKNLGETTPSTIADAFLVYLAHRSLEELAAETKALAYQTSQGSKN